MGSDEDDGEAEEEEELPRGMISYKDLELSEKRHYHAVQSLIHCLQKSSRKRTTSTQSDLQNIKEAKELLKTTLEETPRLALVRSSSKNTCLLQELAFPKYLCWTTWLKPAPPSRFFSPSKDFVLGLAQTHPESLLLPVVIPDGLEDEGEEIEVPHSCCLVAFANEDPEIYGIYDWLASAAGRHMLDLEYDGLYTIGALMSNTVVTCVNVPLCLGDATPFGVARNFFENYPEGMAIQFRDNQCPYYSWYPFERLIWSFDPEYHPILMEDRIALAEWMLDQEPTTWLSKYRPNLPAVTILYSLILQKAEFGNERILDGLCGLTKRMIMRFCPFMTSGVCGILSNIDDSDLGYICRYKVAFDLVVTFLRLYSLETPARVFLPAATGQLESFENSQAALPIIKELVREEAWLQQQRSTLRLARARLLGGSEVSAPAKCEMWEGYGQFVCQRVNNDATTRERIHEIRNELELIRQRIFIQSTANGLYADSDEEDDSDLEDDDV